MRIPDEKIVYSQSQTTKCVQHMITVGWKGGGSLGKIAESSLEDPELRQWHLPMRSEILHQLYEEMAKIIICFG